MIRFIFYLNDEYAHN
uniref:Uncharacterized protein n=1 Tax=Lepeophtheirus salmonis TaxID=72036 RepID=A0A0K2UAM0_LEPSM